MNAPILYERTRPPKRCGAKRKRDGLPCQRWANQTGRCNLHGGKSLVGAASPSYKHGRYSKYIPNDILASYEEGRNDQDLHDLADEISLVTSRINVLLLRIDSGESADRWDELNSEWKNFMIAVRAEDGERQAEHVRTLEQLFRQARDDRSIWTELLDLIERRKRLVEADVRTHVARRQMITIEAALSHLAFLVSAVKEAAFKYADERAARQIIVDTSTAYRRTVGQPVDR